MNKEILKRIINNAYVSGYSDGNNEYYNQEGDIVYCKVRGNFYTHLVKGKNNDKGLLIGNNRGNINGWTKQVYGKVIEIL